MAPVALFIDNPAVEVNTPAVPPLVKVITGFAPVLQ